MKIETKKNCIFFIDICIDPRYVDRTESGRCKEKEESSFKQDEAYIDGGEVI